MLALVVLSAIGLLASGCGGDNQEAAPATTSAAPATAAETEAGTTETTETGTTAALEGDPQAGERVFASAGCGNCHTLAAAGTTGTVGPNLDERQPDFDDVVEQVTNGGGAMPAFGDTLTDGQIVDVAAFVVQATGGGDGETTTDAATTDDDPATTDDEDDDSGSGSDDGSGSENSGSYSG